MFLNVTYGHWTILSNDNVGTEKHPQVMARCICGKENEMEKYEIYNGRVVYANEQHGAILLGDEQWYPFRYLDNGDLNIHTVDGGFIKPSSAFKMASLIFP